MSHEVDPLLLLPEPVRRLPADLAVLICFVIVTGIAVFVPILNETPLRTVVGLLFVLFPPGYAFIAALFPEAGGSLVESTEDAEELDDDATRSRFESGIDGLERVALSFGTSIAIVPLIGLILNFTPWGIRLVPIVVSLSAFTLGATAIAAVRRWDLPEDERFSVPYRSWFGSARAELFEPDTRADVVLNVLLVLCILLATASVGYAVLVPKQDESFSEFYLLTERDNGTLVADNYPQNFTQGQPKPVIVGIDNHEHERTDYTVVVQLQSVTTRNNSTVVTDRQTLKQFHANVEANGTWRTTHRISPRKTGKHLRLTYLLYKGTAPSTPTEDTAYRELHLWVNVTAGNETTASRRSVPSA